MMKNILFAAISVLVLLFLGSVMYAIFQPRPFSQVYNLSLSSKQPYGCLVLKGELENFYPNKNVRGLGSLDLKPYYDYVVNHGEYGYETTDDLDSSLVYRDLGYEVTEKFNFLGISPFFEMSKVDINSLLLHLYQGNEALILADKMNNDLESALQISTEDYSGMDSKELKNAFSLKYKDGQFRQHKVRGNYSAISEYPNDAEVICRNKLGDVLGISIPIGKGRISYFSTPVLFSNLHILKDRRELAEELLASLPLENTYYCQSTGGRAENYTEQPSFLSFIHSQASLTWAYYTLLFSILLFMVFRVRRMQRIIPIVTPPSNSSLEYVESLSNLYLLHNNHKETALKKMNYFLNKIRLEYQLETKEVNDQFYLKLSQKSGVAQKIIKQLFIKYHYIQDGQKVSKEDFQAFCELLQHFKN